MAKTSVNAFTIQLNTNVDTSNIQKTLNRGNYVINADLNTYTLTQSIEKTLRESEKIVSDSWTRIGRTMQTGLQGNFLGQNFDDLIRYVEKYKDSLGNVYEVSNVLTGDGTMLLNRGFQQLKTTLEEVTEISNTTYRTVENGNNAFLVQEKEVQTLSDQYGVLTKKTQQFYNEQGTLVEKTAQFNSANEQVGSTVTKIGEGLRQLTTETTTVLDNQGRLVTTTKELDGGFETSRKVITQWKDELGRTNKKVEEFANNGKTLIKSMTSIDDVTRSFGGTAKLTSSQEYVTRADGIQQLITRTQSLDSNMNKVITTTTKWYNAQGNLTTRIEKTDEAGNRLAKTILKVDANMKQYTETSKTTTTNVVDGVTITTIQEIDAKGQHLTTTIRQLKDEEGYLVTETTKLNNSLGTTTKHVERVNQEFNKQSKGIGALRIGWKDLVQRVSAYYISSLPMRAVTTIIGEAKQAIFEYDKALTELKKVQDFTNESLAQFNKEVAEMASDLATPANELVDAITQFKKSSYNLSESQKLAKVAIMMKNTADSAISASDSASALIAVMKAYNMTAKDAIHITDAVNKVSANYAISSGDITNNLQKVASVMAETNTSYEQSLGLLTAIVEVTRDASIASSALKTISQRIRGIGEDSEQLSGMTGKLQGAFNNLGIGIEIVNQKTGEMASTFDILKAVADRWKYLNDAQRQYIGELMAGKLRITQLDALMNNFSTAIEATDDAMNSAGTTAKQYDVQMESLQGRINNLKTNFTNAINEGGSLNKAVKTVVNTLNSLVNILRDIVKVVNPLLDKVTSSLSGTEKSLGAIIVLLEKIVSIIKNMPIVSELIEIVGAINNITNPMIMIDKVTDYFSSSRTKSANKLYEERKDIIEKLLKQGMSKSDIQEKLEGMKNFDKAYSEVLEKISQEERANEKVKNIILNIAKALGLIKTETKEVDKQFVALSDDAQKVFDKVSISELDIDGITNAFSKLTQAMGEYKDTKEITVKSYEDLMSLDTGYLIQLFDEEGQLENTAEAQRKLYNAKIDELAVTQALNLIELATTYYKEEQTLDSLKTMVENATGSTWDLVYAQLGELKALGATDDELKPLITQIENYQAMAESAKKSTQAFTEEQNKLSLASKDLKNNLDKLKDIKSDYDSVISYVEDKVSDYINKLEQAKDKEIDAIEKELELINDEKTAFENAIEDKIKAIEDEKNAYDDMMDKQKDKLNDLKDAEKEYWETKKKELQHEKNLRERNIKLQEKEKKLAEAQATKVMVYKEGKGFVYEADESKINEARDELEEQRDENSYEEKLEYYDNMANASEKYYKKELDKLATNKNNQDDYWDKEKKLLQEEKEEKKRYFEQEKERLNDEKTLVKDHYDEIILYYKNWLNEFKISIKNYQDSEIALNAEQLTGINWENENWQTRLSNMDSFVQDYKSKLDEIKKATKEYNDSQEDVKISYKQEDVYGVNIKESLPFFTQHRNQSIMNKESNKKPNDKLTFIDLFGGNLIFDTFKNAFSQIDFSKMENKQTFSIDTININGANINDANSFANMLKSLPQLAQQRAFTSPTSN